METFLYAFISVLVISLISLGGGLTLSFSKKILKKISRFLISFAVGTLLGDAFIHLIPQAFIELGTTLETSLLIIVGIIIFFVLEKFLRWRHCHSVDCQEHKKALAMINLVGDGIHNFIDGLLIAASYLVSFPIGLSTTFAVICHEIPQEMGDLGVLLHSGLSPLKAVLFNFLSATISFLGMVVSFLIAEKVQHFATWFLPITAGGFIYIAGADLVPELHHETEIKVSLGQLFSLLLGLTIMAALVLLD